MIRETIKDAMKVRKVKQKDLANFIDISESNMSRFLFLNGKVNLGQDTLEAMFKFLNIEIRVKE